MYKMMFGYVLNLTMFLSTLSELLVLVCLCSVKRFLKSVIAYPQSFKLATSVLGRPSKYRIACYPLPSHMELIWVHLENQVPHTYTPRSSPGSQQNKRCVKDYFLLSQPLLYFLILTNVGEALPDLTSLNHRSLLQINLKICLECILI